MKRNILLSKTRVIMLCVLFSMALLDIVEAQEKYPAREITLITGTSAGAATEVLQRAICTAASKILGQNIIVINKPGASYALALSAVKNAKPDGYTLGAIPSAPVASQHMKKVPYDVLKDFTYIIQVADNMHGLIVQASAPWKTAQELIEYIKNNPGKVRMAVLGVGSGQHLAMERLSIKIGGGFKIIPFGDSATAETNLLGGHVEAAFIAQQFVPNVQAGVTRVLAIAGGKEKRSPQFPNVPALMELYGIGVPGYTCYGGPQGLPRHVVDTIHGAFKKAMEDPDVINTAEKFNTPIVYRGPEELTKYVQETYDVVGSIVRQLGLKE